MNERNGGLPGSSEQRVKGQISVGVTRPENKGKNLGGYQIVGGLDENGKPKETDRGEMGIEYQFVTVWQGDWQVLVKKDMKYTPPPDLKERAGILRDLTFNQAGCGVRSWEEKMHQRVINFFAANWPILAPIFYPIEIDQGEGPELVGFSEVYLGSVGRADFVGIGPDGRCLIFEVGKGGKGSQIERYRQNLVKMGVPEEMIMGFTINYSSTARQTKLTIRQAF